MCLYLFAICAQWCVKNVFLTLRQQSYPGTAIFLTFFNRFSHFPLIWKGQLRTYLQQCCSLCHVLPFSLGSDSSQGFYFSQDFYSSQGFDSSCWCFSFWHFQYSPVSVQVIMRSHRNDSVKSVCKNIGCSVRKCGSGYKHCTNFCSSSVLSPGL